MVADIWSERTYRYAEMSLDKVLSESRRMGRASARACEDEGGWMPPDAAQQFGQGSLKRLRLPHDRAGALLPFRFHLEVEGQIAHRGHKK